MSSFQVGLSAYADAQYKALEVSDPKKHKKVKKALRLLGENPKHSGLNAHKFDTLKGKAPDKGDMWECYVENHTPSAWRIFFYYPKGQKGVIAVTSIEPHP